MIDKFTIDRIFAAADVVDVVNDFVTLRKKGVNYQALCPFHNEKTPSFVVSPSKGLFKCFGCGKGGNAITFVMEHEGLNYPEALRYVAKKYGIEVKERELTPEQQQQNNDRESMMAVTDFAAKWFREQLLTSEEGQSVGLSYMRERGFTDSTIAKFEIGYSPRGTYSSQGGQNPFTEEALKAGYKEEFLVKTGLTGKGESGELYDRFGGRVIFPINSVSGRTIAFGGRTLRTDKKVAKYVNSPESELYHKSEVLYGLSHAKRAIGQEENCILVEGYTDVMSMFQAGVENVVATSGTALTEAQVKLIGRFTEDVIMLFDGDRAGVMAAMRGVDIILRGGLNVRVVSLPEDADPDSFAKEHSAGNVRKYIETNAEDFIAFKTRTLLGGVGDDPIRRAAAINDVVESIAEVEDPIKRSVYVQQTAKQMEMERQLLASEVAKKRVVKGRGESRESRQFIRNQQIQQKQGTIIESQMTRLKGVTIGSSMDELEKELMKYLLKYGERNFDYKEGKEIVSLNVTESIVNDLEANELKFNNVVYREMYECYLEHYREDDVDVSSSLDGKEEQKRHKIEIHHFVNHHNPEVSNAAVDILTDNENYTASRMWKKFDVVIESEEERLSEIIPRTVILYKSKAIELIIEALQKRLKSEELSDEEQDDLIYRISALNRARTPISRSLSRLIL